MEKRLPTVDLIVKGMGRFKRSAGTADMRTVTSIRSWLKEMKRDGRTEVFEALRDHRHTPHELYQAYKKGKLNEFLRTWETSGGFAAMYRWLETYEGASPDHKRNMRNHFQQLERLRPYASIQELPTVLAKYREVCQGNGTNRMFQSVRSSVLSFLNQQTGFGSDHPTYLAVRRVQPLSYTPKRRDQAPHLCEIKRLVQGMPEALRHQTWSMVFTGIELGVYERGGYYDLGTHLHIAGSKSARGDRRRERDVPRFWSITPLARKRKAFRGWLKKYSQLNGLSRIITPKDLRNAYALLLFESGIPEVRCEMYMGHAPATMTRRYARSKVDDYLLPDSAQLGETVDALLRACGSTDENDVGPEVLSKVLDAKMFLARPHVSSGAP
jgi:hypothetical protein